VPCAFGWFEGKQKKLIACWSKNVWLIMKLSKSMPPKPRVLWKVKEKVY